VKLKTIVEKEAIREGIRDKFFEYGFFVERKQDNTDPDDVVFAKAIVLASVDNAFVHDDFEGENYLYLKERLVAHFVITVTLFVMFFSYLIIMEYFTYHYC